MLIHFSQLDLAKCGLFWMTDLQVSVITLTWKRWIGGRNISIFELIICHLKKNTSGKVKVWTIITLVVNCVSSFNNYSFSYLALILTDTEQRNNFQNRIYWYSSRWRHLNSFLPLLLPLSPYQYNILSGMTNKNVVRHEWTRTSQVDGAALQFRYDLLIKANTCYIIFKILQNIRNPVN